MTERGDGKILALPALAERLAKRRDAGDQIVHCHGVFDLLSPAQIRGLELAAELGDALVVTVVGDGHAVRGSSAAIFDAELRARTLAALGCVAHVAIDAEGSAARAIELLRPSIYVRGTGSEPGPGPALERLAGERTAAERVGARIERIDGADFSSAHLLDERFAGVSPEADAYLRGVASRHSSAEVVEQLRALREMRVLVIGDTIIDEYHFCRPFGKASKSSAISAQFQRAEIYAGGVLAVANHLAGFCGEVELVTCVGAQDSREDFVRAHLKPNVRAHCFARPDAPTTVKRRFVEGFLMTKFFEVSFFNDSPLPAPLESEVRAHVARAAPDRDMVLVADFGHGLMTPGVVDSVCESSRYLALNTQLNSINMGYNVVTRYPRADYVCIDEGETRLATRDRFSPLPELVTKLARDLSSQVFTTTRGKAGALLWEANSGFHEAPVLSREVVDTIGAGDAFLAVTAPCARAGMAPELLGLVGNAVGSLAVRIVGNKESVEPEPLYAHLRTLLGR